MSLSEKIQAAREYMMFADMAEVRGEDSSISAWHKQLEHQALQEALIGVTKVASDMLDDSFAEEYARKILVHLEPFSDRLPADS